MKPEKLWFLVCNKLSFIVKLNTNKTYSSDKIKGTINNQRLTNNMSNQIMVIFPYLYEDTWVFDDRDTGLEKEPFVCGIPEMINIM